MRRRIKNIFPTFFSLLSLLAFEILNNVDVIKQNFQIDFQIIGNVLILIIGTYNILHITMEMKQSHNILEIYYLNNYLTILSAFILNIDIFENEIERISDFFVGWHTMWSTLFLVSSLWFTGIGKSTYGILKNMVQYVMNSGKSFINWALGEIKNIHKGVLFVVSFGLIIWFALLVHVNKEKYDFFMEQFFRYSLIFWCAWFIICILIFFFVNFSVKISEVVKDMKSANIMKLFLWIIIGVVVLFVSLQVFPLIFSTIGNMLPFPLTISLVAAAIIFWGKEKFARVLMVNWKDVAVVFGIVILVTFVLLPIIGAASNEGQDILISDNVENFKTFIELIMMGIGTIREFW